ncbi:hypothetical protein [Chitinophaga rhizosphaerae]|uniref:hypothetical protein n=1 Tax=Chitinophaga rhizosphaerae TaxID=1864947 RepID=UPI000F805FA5|nr:hypothetical protein [Chitinophaga rhizosphaerae]
MSSKREKQEEGRKAHARRISAFQKQGFTIYRIAKGGYDGEHWGYKHKDGRSGGGFDRDSDVMDYLERMNMVNFEKP